MEDVPLLLVHGIPGSARVWDGVRAELEGDFEVIAPDLLGFGENAAEPDPDGLWAGSQARALAAMLDDRGVERAAVVGHDFGGPVVLELCALRPQLVTHLVLCATNTFPDVPIPMPIRAVTWPVVGDVAARVLLSAPALRMMAPSELVTDVQSARTVFVTALRELEERYAPVERALRSVPCPSLVVWAGRDRFFEIEQGRRTADALPNGRLVVYDDCGHYVPVEQPERLAAEIGSFVRTPVAA
jgi:pimeloyl-ACP methyl ester carboxylesterase